jgi:hypothetical protein
MIVDYLACAAICDDHGFTRQAELLRAAGAGWLRVFAVLDCVRDEDRRYCVSPVDGEIRSVHLDRESAERDARRRELEAFRERDFLTSFRDDLGFLTDLGPDELSRRIGEILGMPFTLPEIGSEPAPLFPALASDSQIAMAMELFTIRFFHIIELEFAG